MSLRFRCTNSYHMAAFSAWIRCLFFVAVVILITSSSAQPTVFNRLSGYRPMQSHPIEKLEDKCKTEEEVKTTCQRCAKSTKSNIVYPMCCTNEEEVQTWCDRYLNFGIQ